MTQAAQAAWEPKQRSLHVPPCCGSGPPLGSVSCSTPLARPRRGLTRRAASGSLLDPAGGHPRASKQRPSSRAVAGQRARTRLPATVGATSRRCRTTLCVLVRLLLLQHWSSTAWTLPIHTFPAQYGPLVSHCAVSRAQALARWRVSAGAYGRGGLPAAAQGHHWRVWAAVLTLLAAMFCTDYKIDSCFCACCNVLHHRGKLMWYLLHGQLCFGCWTMFTLIWLLGGSCDGCDTILIKFFQVFI